jgi:hypothetical protein
MVGDKAAHGAHYCDKNMFMNSIDCLDPRGARSSTLHKEQQQYKSLFTFIFDLATFQTLHCIKLMMLVDTMYWLMLASKSQDVKDLCCPKDLNRAL